MPEASGRPDPVGTEVATAARTRRVTVVIPVHNRRAITVAGVRSLLDADRTGIELRVVVVDDGSTDGTAEALHEHCPEAEIVTGDGTLHYAGGTNAGLAVALADDELRPPDFVVVANDDAIFDRAVLVELVAAAERHPGDLIGARLVSQDDPTTTFQVGLHFDVRFGGWQVPQGWRVDDLPDGDLPVETLVGNCLLVPASAAREVGPMDAARFPIGAADVQWVRRMQERGRRCFVATRAHVECRPNDVLPSLTSLGARGTIRVLFRDRSHPLNLGRHWRAVRYSAPSRTAAAAAFACHVVNLAGRALGIGSWPHWPDPEMPRAWFEPPSSSATSKEQPPSNERPTAESATR